MAVAAFYFPAPYVGAVIRYFIVVQLVKPV